MDEHRNGFSERLEQLVGEYVEVRLTDEKTIGGRLLAVEKGHMNVAISARARKGSYFYWLFTDDSTIGRKLRKGKEAKPQAAKTDVEAIKSKFPSELVELLTFTAEEQFIVLKPKQFLGSENFAKIAAIVREVKGEYVSKGKDSHFKIPRKK